MEKQREEKKGNLLDRSSIEKIALLMLNGAIAIVCLGCLSYFIANLYDSFGKLKELEEHNTANRRDLLDLKDSLRKTEKALEVIKEVRKRLLTETSMTPEKIREVLEEAKHSITSLGLPPELNDAFIQILNGRTPIVLAPIDVDVSPRKGR